MYGTLFQESARQEHSTSRDSRASIWQSFHRKARMGRGSCKLLYALALAAQLSDSDIMSVVSLSESTLSDCLRCHTMCAGQCDVIQTRNLERFRVGVRVVAGAFITPMTNIATKKKRLKELLSFSRCAAREAP